jgi:phosphoglycolate phosphatase-like HAD superfamily hydrolase
MNGRAPVTAILWDFDGTLADTRHKNLSVNRRIVSEVSGRRWPDFAALRTIEAYDEAVRRAANWRELYRANFGFSDLECDRAASVWASYQLQDSTPAPLFEGLPEVVRELADLPQGIVSQNARDHIIERLAEAGLERHFGSIVGYQEVPLGRQKPDPDGLLVGLEELTAFAPGCALYIGDHEGDTLCAAATNRILWRRGIDLEVLSVAAMFAADGDHRHWRRCRPDYTAAQPADVITIVDRLRAL